MTPTDDASRGVPSARARRLFALLVAAQAAHSIEEYVGRLWESFPPARFITGVVSSDREVGFFVINAALVAFGVWCFLWPVRRRWPIATSLMWLWIVVQIINGVVHPLWSIRQGGYTPGVVTAPLLFIIAVSLARELRRTPTMVSRVTRESRTW